MTAKRLMQVYNKNAKVTCTLNVCEHFLEEYSDELKGLSNSEIDNAFANYMYELCFM